MEEALILSPDEAVKKYKTGTKFARFFRHIFEHNTVKKALGSILAVAVVLSGTFPPMTNALASDQAESVHVESAKLVLTTEKGTQYPTKNIHITQGFRLFHPGLDLDGITGDSIKPIKGGIVSDVNYSKFAYGNSVIIDHGNQVTSLYAHLSKIEVKEGQTVDVNTEIGKMGATGRSFGDHLHLEVRDHGRAINPLTVLPR